MSVDLTSAATESFGDVQHPANGDPRDANVLKNIFGQPVVNALLWLRRRAEENWGQLVPIGGLLPLPIESVNPATDTITLTGHGLTNGDDIEFITVPGASLPSPCTAAQSYVVVNATSNTFQISYRASGAAFDLTSSQSGSVYVRRVNGSLGVRRLRYRCGLGGPTSPVSIDDGLDTYLYTEPGSDTAVTLAATASPPGRGRRLRFMTNSVFATHKVTFKNDSAVTLATFPAGTGLYSWVEFEFVLPLGSGGAWWPTAWGGGTTVP